MTRKPSGCQAAREYSLIQAAQDGVFGESVRGEVGNGEAATAFAVGDALGDALVRPGRIVMHLVFGQHGALMRLTENQHAVQELTAQRGTSLASAANQARCGLVPHPAGAPPQYRVLVPEHQQLGILRQVAAEHQDGQTEHPARKQVDDLEQHPGKLTITMSSLLAKA